jgi:hypothetical protein
MRGVRFEGLCDCRGDGQRSSNVRSLSQGSPGNARSIRRTVRCPWREPDCSRRRMAASTIGDHRVSFARCRGRLVQVSGVSKDNLAQAQEYRWEPDYRRRVRTTVTARRTSYPWSRGRAVPFLCESSAVLDAVQDASRRQPGGAGAGDHADRKPARRSSGRGARVCRGESMSRSCRGRR